MRNRRRRFTAAAIVFGLGMLASGAFGVTWATFAATTSNSGNSFSANTDFQAPSVTGPVIDRSGDCSPNTTGYVKQGGAYFVYSNVTDSGNPSSGVSTVTADAHNVTTGQSSASMTTTGGPWTVAGTSYNYRSSSLTADNPLTAGSKSYSVAATDGHSNSTNASASVTVDNTVPSASDIQTTNKTGGTNGKPEQGDSITLTYSEPVETCSILSGWDGSSQVLYVQLTNGGGGNDTITFFSTVSPFPQLPMGSINLGRTDYTSGNVTFGGATSSTMVVSGNSIVVTLGTASAADTIAASTGTMTWTPSATATDRAGNACSTTAANESGAADKDF